MVSDEGGEEEEPNHVASQAIMGLQLLFQMSCEVSGDFGGE